MAIAFTKTNFYFYAKPKQMNFLEKINKWIGTITAAIACFVAYQTYFTKQKVENIEIQKQTFDNKKDSLNFTRDREFKFKIYELVTDAIKEKNDTLKQRAASIVVSELVSDEDKDFKLGLLKIINSFSNDVSVKTDTKIAIFNVEQAQSANMSDNTEKGDPIRVDIFYGEVNAQNTKQLAIEVSNILPKRFLTQIKPLSNSINKRPGYNVDKNQIRYEANEKDYVSEILVNLKAANPNLHFETQEITYVTPDYISIFIVE